MEAAEWVVRLDNPNSRSAETEFQRWMATSDAHREAYARAKAVWSEVAAVQSSQMMPIPSGDQSPAVVVHANFRPALWRMVGAAAACLLLAIGIGFYWVGDPIIALKADYRTAPGEQRVVRLADGSTVELGPSSAIDVRYGPTERRVELLSGVAFFTAAPRQGAEIRAFVVESAGGQVTAVGTQFSVDRLDDTVDVTVAEHRVDVSLISAGRDGDPVHLSEGNQLYYSAAKGIGAIETVDIDQAMGWRRGRLIFNNVPLSRVVTELNRYRRGRIVITSTDLADRRVSGVFDTGDLDSALGRIVSELHLRTASLPPVVTLLY